jgi:hypothetical protein
MPKRLNVEFSIEDAQESDFELLQKRQQNAMSLKIANGLMSIKNPVGKKIELPSVELQQARNLANSVNQILKQKKQRYIIKARAKSDSDSVLIVVERKEK